MANCHVERPMSIQSVSVNAHFKQVISSFQR
jgi:hypothetical protein